MVLVPNLYINLISAFLTWRSCRFVKNNQEHGMNIFLLLCNEFFFRSFYRVRHKS